jgi:transcriptional regulator with XRE-family HTH domain
LPCIPRAVRASARDAAHALGVSEHTVSAWLTGKRRPRLDVMVNLAQVYDVDTRTLMGDPMAFARQLGDEERIQNAERNLAQLAGRTIAPERVRDVTGGIVKLPVRPPERVRDEVEE